MLAGCTQPKLPAEHARWPAAEELRIQSFASRIALFPGADLLLEAWGAGPGLLRDTWDGRRYIAPLAFDLPLVAVLRDAAGRARWRGRSDAGRWHVLRIPAIAGLPAGPAMLELRVLGHAVRREPVQWLPRSPLRWRPAPPRLVRAARDPWKAFEDFARTLPDARLTVLSPEPAALQWREGALWWQAPGARAVRVASVPPNRAPTLLACAHGFIARTGDTLLWIRKGRIAGRAKAPEGAGAGSCTGGWWVAPAPAPAVSAWIAVSPHAVQRLVAPARPLRIGAGTRARWIAIAADMALDPACGLALPLPKPGVHGPFRAEVLADDPPLVRITSRARPAPAGRPGRAPHARPAWKTVHLIPEPAGAAPCAARAPVPRGPARPPRS